MTLSSIMIRIIGRDRINTIGHPRHELIGIIFAGVSAPFNVDGCAGAALDVGGLSLCERQRRHRDKNDGGSDDESA